MKDLVIIIGTILIIIILIDGIRRKRNERNGNIRVSRSMKKRTKPPQPEYEEDIPVELPSYTSELPNGGARVIGQRESNGPLPSIEKKATAKSYLEKQQRQELLHSDISRRPPRDPEQANLNLGESVPILMESVQDALSRQSERSHPHETRIEPGFSAHRDDDDDLDTNVAQQDDLEEDDYDTDERIEPVYETVQDDDETETQYDEDYDDEQEENAHHEELDDDEVFDEDEYSRTDDYEEKTSQTATQHNPAAQQLAEPEEVLIINVMAFKGEMFNGGDLLDIVLKCGMRYGSMDIFHRYSDAKGEGTLLFSMANMVKPGTFDLDAMEEFETPGVSLFMTLPLNADSMQSFDLMLDTARAIAETLDGELKDEQRSVMTRQTVEHCRQRIRDFERKRLFHRPR